MRVMRDGLWDRHIASSATNTSKKSILISPGHKGNNSAGVKEATSCSNQGTASTHPVTSHLFVDKMTKDEYDVCIIGSGPAGLAALSAVQEPYSQDTLSDAQINRAGRSLSLCQRRKVCVIDPNANWLHSWETNFDCLDIQFLRSPLLAHPDGFDKGSLLAYAVANNRTDELLDSGCIDVQKLKKDNDNLDLWKLPSTSLFIDFCRDLADKLSHDYIQGHITDISRPSFAPDSTFNLVLNNGKDFVSAKAVILALGPVGHSIVPRGIASLPQSVYDQRVYSWTQLDKVRPESDTILVVGGGLTAVQVALKLCKLGKNCILASRRPIVERHFDIGLEWFELRTANKCMSDFYHLPMEDRLSALREVRGGGSVPPLYMRKVEKAEALGKLIRVVGEVKCDGDDFCGKQLRARIAGKNGSAEESFCVDEVVLACGLRPDSHSTPVVKSALEKWPIPVCGGLPSVTEDLQWKGGLALFVIGALGGLNIGPDAGNLMGARRAANLIANGLDCRSWLRMEGCALVNPFDAFLFSDSSDDDSDSDDESDEDSFPS